jgi:ABC-type multidrug transport system fused ATPase/permease subunit
VVPQKDLLFNDTIKKNILYVKMDAKDDEVKKSCELAAIHKTIMTFPNSKAPLHFNVQQICLLTLNRL